jgi:hypothetical protein
MGIDYAFVPVNPLAIADPYALMIAAAQVTMTIRFGPLLETPVLRPVVHARYEQRAEQPMACSCASTPTLRTYAPRSRQFGPGPKKPGATPPMCRSG